MASWVPVPEGSPFPLHNLPYGVFKPRRDPSAAPRPGVAIGEHVLDLSVLHEAGLFDGPLMRPNSHCLAQPTLNAFMALGRPAWKEARATITRLLSSDCPTLRDNAALRARALVPLSEAAMQLPAAIGDYTDFYSSREHATNVGIMFRGKDNALQPNWLHLPVGYHGRASSIVVSGTDIPRPRGQTKADTAPAPSHGPAKTMDFELEMGFFVGPGNALAEPIPVDRALDHIFGLVIFNDWSARDVQKWEYVPLGPFNGKNFASSISPWVVTLEALEPFRCEAPPQEPAVLEYLREAERTTFDIALEVAIQGERMAAPATVSRTNFRHLYWTMAQQLAHHTSTGCNMRPGDLCASGTISGPTDASLGSMLELSWGGTREVTLAEGEVRKFLQDGDTVVMRASCARPGLAPIGFGECVGKLLPPR
eukprot:tig00020614_g12182.t1